MVFVSNRFENLNEAVHIAAGKGWTSIIREAIIDVHWAANSSLAGLAQVGEGLCTLTLSSSGLMDYFAFSALQLFPSMLMWQIVDTCDID